MANKNGLKKWQNATTAVVSQAAKYRDRRPKDTG
jgi:hypothetical protein